MKLRIRGDYWECKSNMVLNEFVIGLSRCGGVKIMKKFPITRIVTKDIDKKRLKQKQHGTRTKD